MKLMLITGANGQLGSFLARQYHAEGYSLILLYHKRSERIQSFMGLGDCWLGSVDLGDYSACNEAYKQAVKHFGKSPEILIHCAAMRSEDALPLVKTQPDTFTRVFNTNFLPAYHILRCVLPDMQEKSFGRVIVLGSDVTRSGLANGSAYAAAKAAIVNLVKSSGRELASHNVLINAISPGPVDTVLEEDYSGAYLEFRRQYFASYKESVPSGKLVSKEEIKKVADLLMAEELHSICGEEIIINGG